jgi:oligopeptidase B
MRQHNRFLLLVLMALTGLPAVANAREAQTKPPTATERPVQLEKHGHVRMDPYFWLRERENPEVIAYLQAENAYFKGEMAPVAQLQETLFEEIKGRIEQDDASVPYLLGDHYYYRRFEKGRQYPIYARKAGSLQGPEQILIDVNEKAKEHDFYSVQLDTSSISPDGRTLAWAADSVGRRFYAVRFLDMETGAMLHDVIPNMTGNVAWANDSRTVFYSKQDPTTLRPHQIYRHTLGTDPVTDVLVYEELDDTFHTLVSKTKDGEYLLIGSFQTLATEWRTLKADQPEGAFQVFQPRERKHEYIIEHAGDHFYIRTNRDAENFRLMRTPENATSEEHWEEVIGHRHDVLLVAFESFRDHLVVTERRDGLNRLRVRPWKQPDAEYDVPFDDPAYAVSLGDNIVLLHTNMGAGHGGASGRYDRYRETARDYAFLLRLAGLQ